MLPGTKYAVAYPLHWQLNMWLDKGGEYLPSKEWVDLVNRTAKKNSGKNYTKFPKGYNPKYELS